MGTGGRRVGGNGGGWSQFWKARSFSFFDDIKIIVPTCSCAGEGESMRDLGKRRRHGLGE